VSSSGTLAAGRDTTPIEEAAIIDDVFWLLLPLQQSGGMDTSEDMMVRQTEGTGRD
jgi:hypothetical protein